MNNPRIDELLNELAIEKECKYTNSTEEATRLHTIVSINAYLKGTLEQMKCEFEFLRNMLKIEMIGTITKVPKTIKRQIKELNSDIKRIEEMLK